MTDMTATATADETPKFNVGASEPLDPAKIKFLKHNDTFVILGNNGDVAANSLQGIYSRDMRHASLKQVLINGKAPIALSCSVGDDNVLMTSHLTNPDMQAEKPVKPDPAGPDMQTAQKPVEHNQLDVTRSQFVYNDTLHERIAVRNYATEALEFQIEIKWDSDFVDIFEVRGTQRDKRGRRHQPNIVDAQTVIHAATGLDNKKRETVTRFDPPPATLEGKRAVYRLRLAPGEGASFFVESGCGRKQRNLSPARLFFQALRAHKSEKRKSYARTARVSSSNEDFNKVFRRSESDLHTLTTQTEHGLYPYAGAPWFCCPFGRDGLTTALQREFADPALLKGVTRWLAENQAKTYDAFADAEPGRITHEFRQGEMANTREVPFGAYYGSIDAPALFVMGGAAHLRRTGDTAAVRANWEAIEAALTWMDTDGDKDRDGFVEYARAANTGIGMQGWQDSHDSIFHADGSFARTPIALIEVQAEVYGARRGAAEIARALARDDRATAAKEAAKGQADQAREIAERAKQLEARAVQLDRQAEELRRKIDKAFWCEETGSYALALDADKKQCKTMKSNAGYMLWTGAAYPERAQRVAEALMSPAFSSGWGIRTLATGQARYNPMSYHNGSVWPHDNSILGVGFGNYGMRDKAAMLLDIFIDVALRTDNNRLPELFSGFARRKGREPVPYGVACPLQAWAAGTPSALLAASLGIGFDIENKLVTFDRPVLPSKLPDVTLHDLAIGDAKIDVQFTRNGNKLDLKVLKRTGDIDARIVALPLEKPRMPAAPARRQPAARKIPVRKDPV